MMTAEAKWLSSSFISKWVDETQIELLTWLAMGMIQLKQHENNSTGGVGVFVNISDCKHWRVM